MQVSHACACICVFVTQGDSWHLIIATCIGGDNYSTCELPRVRLYSSPTLPPGPTGWALTSDLFVGAADTGIRPECPRLWRFLAPPGGCPGHPSAQDVTLLVFSSTLQVATALRAHCIMPSRECHCRLQGRSLWFIGPLNASNVLLPVASGVVDYGTLYAAHLFPGEPSWGIHPLVYHRMNVCIALLQPNLTDNGEVGGQQLSDGFASFDPRHLSM